MQERDSISVRTPISLQSHAFQNAKLDGRAPAFARVRVNQDLHRDLTHSTRRDTTDRLRRTPGRLPVGRRSVRLSSPPMYTTHRTPPPLDIL